MSRSDLPQEYQSRISPDESRERLEMHMNRFNKALSEDPRSRASIRHYRDIYFDLIRFSHDHPAAFLATMESRKSAILQIDREADSIHREPLAHEGRVHSISLMLNVLMSQAAVAVAPAPAAVAPAPAPAPAAWQAPPPAPGAAAAAWQAPPPAPGAAAGTAALAAAAAASASAAPAAVVWPAAASVPQDPLQVLSNLIIDTVKSSMSTQSSDTAGQERRGRRLLESLRDMDTLSRERLKSTLETQIKSKDGSQKLLKDVMLTEITTTSEYRRQIRSMVYQIFPSQIEQGASLPPAAASAAAQASAEAAAAMQGRLSQQSAQVSASAAAAPSPALAQSRQQGSGQGRV